MLKKILNTIATQFLGAILNFLTFVIISQYLGSEVRGEAGLILSTITLVLLFVNIVTGASLVYLFPRYNNGILILGSYLWTVLISSVAYILIQQFHSEFNIPIQFAKDIIYLTGINAIFNTHLNYLISKQRIVLNNYFKLLQSIIIVGAIAFSVIITKESTIVSYINALYIAFGTGALLSFTSILKELKNIELNQIIPICKEAFKYGLINQSAHIIQVFNFRISYYILYGQFDLGNYANAVSICEAIWIITKSIALVQYAKVVNTNKSNNQIKTSLVLGRWSLLISLIVGLVLILLPSEFFTFVFGKDFSMMASIILYLVPSIIIYSFGQIIQHYYSGNGKFQVNVIGSFIGFIVTISILPLLVSIMQEKGAALASSISYIATTLVICGFFFYKNRISINEIIPKRSDLKYLKLED